MNEQRQNVNEFEELFQEHKIDPVQKPPQTRSHYFLAILYYLLIMLVFSTIIVIVFATNDSFKKTYTQDELVIRDVASDSDGLTLLPTNVYQTYMADYESYVTSLGVYDGYEVLVNITNVYAPSYLQINQASLNNINIESILTGQRTSWDDTDIYTINVYQSSLSPFPAITTIETYVESDTMTDLTSLASALQNFIVYMALSPVLAFAILRRDITADILVYKKKWSSFISAVLIGYALALVGNFVANFISGFVGELFGQMQSTSANQMAIQQALQSNGMIFMVLSAVILGPVAEELIFRRSIFALFKNQIVALFVSALAFGGIHLLSEPTIQDAIVNGIVYISLGFIFGYIYIRNKQNIAINIAVHIVYNLVSVLAALLLL